MPTIIVITVYVSLYRGYSCYARATITLVNFADNKDNHSRGMPVFLINFLCTYVIRKHVYDVHSLCVLTDV